MTTTNRYAPPKAELRDHDGVETEMWREGKVLAMRRGGLFPNRCIKCNAPAVAPGRRQKLTWHPPAWYLLILLAVLLYAIVAMIVRKTATIEIGLCERHQKRVLWGRIVGWGGFAAMLRSASAPRPRTRARSARPWRSSCCPGSSPRSCSIAWWCPSASTIATCA